MRNSTIAAVAAMAALGFGASAQHATRAVHAEPAPAVPAAEPVISTAELVQKVLQAMDEQVALLKSATDRQTADVAGAKLEQLTHELGMMMNALVERLGSAQVMTPEDKAAMAAKVQAMDEEYGRLAELPQRFYGSSYLEACCCRWDTQYALEMGVELSEEFMGKLTRAAALLEGVHDCAAADAAAAEVEQLLTEAVVLDERMDSLIPYEMRCRLKRMTTRQFQSAAVRLMKAVEPLSAEPCCHGSAKLQAALECLPVFDFSEGVQEK